MVVRNKDETNRYVNDLRRFSYSQSQVIKTRSSFLLLGLALLFLFGVAAAVLGFVVDEKSEALVLVAAAVIGGYMAMNIGANDVANAMGTSVGSRALTVKQAIVLAAIFEALGALLAGGQVTNTIRDGVIDSSVYQHDLHGLAVGMLSSLWASGSWLLLATSRGWPVSTTHTIIGSVLGFALISVGLDGIRWSLVFIVFSSWAVGNLGGY